MLKTDNCHARIKFSFFPLFAPVEWAPLKTGIVPLLIFKKKGRNGGKTQEKCKKIEGNSEDGKNL